MTTYYLDTSALAKRYIIEQGTSWVRDLTSPLSNNTIIVSDLTPIEIFSVIERKESGSFITQLEADKHRDAFLIHYGNEYVSVQLSNEVLIRARHLVTVHKKLRTLDAIQLASAVEATKIFGTSIIFVSADKNLSAAAIVEGFNIDNPESHA